MMPQRPSSSQKRSTHPLAYVFVLIAVIFLVIAAMSGAMAFLVHQRAADSADAVAELTKRSLFSFVLAVVAAASAKNWFRR